MVHVTLYPRTTLLYEVPSSGRIAQSIFMGLLLSSSKELALQVRREELKSYSVSRITTNKDRIRGRIARVPPDDFVKVTFKLLDDKLLDPLIKGLTSTSTKLTINGVTMEVADIRVSSKGYWNLLFDSPIAKGVTFRLITPALGIEREFPPSAPVIFRRAFRAWNKFSNIKLPELIMNRLLWAEPAFPTCLQSDAVEFTFRGKRQVLVGYRGLISYKFGRFLAQEGKIIAGLARYVEFSGIGGKTSMGFGITKVRLWRSRVMKNKNSKDTSIHSTKHLE